MTKNTSSDHFLIKKSDYKDFIKIMKTCLLFLFVFTFQLMATDSKAQNAVIVLESNTSTVIQLINQIEKQTDYLVVYSNREVDTNRKINFKNKSNKVSAYLDEAFSGTDIGFDFENDYIVLSKRSSIGQNLNAAEITKLRQQNDKTIRGNVRDENGDPVIGATVIVQENPTKGTITDLDGNFVLTDISNDAIIIISYVGMLAQTLPTDGREIFNIVMEADAELLEELVVVGYGTQKKSDITGTVASLGKERLEMVPNLNIAQAIQGAIPGVMIQTTSAGAAPSEAMLVRGRNSIRASNDPLIVVDGIPYSGSISSINPNDVQSIEVLKDASASAIYGSRGSNGVILITTKTGVSAETIINYDGYYSVQDFVKLPDVMNGEEFYKFKKERWPNAMTLSEEAIYQSGEWIDWLDLGLRKGHSQQHNISASGSFKNTKFYISGGILDVKGLVVNDDFMRLSNRINIDTKLRDWITLGTRTQFSYDDQSGSSPSMGTLFWMNPLTKSLDENGNYLIYPWAEDPFFEHPLSPTLYDNIQESYQIVANNYAVVDVPFIQGLSYRINAGIMFRYRENATYRGRDTKTGFEAGGTSDTQRRRNNNTVIENILSYNREFGVHNLFLTSVYSYENSKYSSQSLSARGFPHDFLTWYASAQAELSVPSFDFDETTLVSQMLRLNYSYDSRYLMTLTGRRDGYSGFGSGTKWGVFPSVALGWNISNEDFYTLKNVISDLKLRGSYGLNGNQAVGAYQSISRLSGKDMVYDGIPYAGYIPSVLGQDELGWESSRTLNIGFDAGILKNRFTTEINFYKTNTTDLLLDRSISSVHGITSITQNIGETENLGLELTLLSRNIVSGDFTWNTSGNLAYMKNKIVSLYGMHDDQGNEIDDVANAWFIGQPIRVNYHWAWDGVWQLNEAEKAAKYGSQPGFVKLRDLNDDGELTGEDRVIIGQQDPKFLWGMTNSFKYQNFNLDIFIHGVHGVTKHNTLMTDDETYSQARRRTINKNYWTPENPTNDWVANVIDAERMGGIIGRYYENASFIRVKDISLSYDFSDDILESFRVKRLRLYVTGRNLFTFTKWTGLDPELSGQVAAPLQKEFVFGINLSL